MAELFGLCASLCNVREGSAAQSSLAGLEREVGRPNSAAAMAWSCFSCPAVGHHFDSKLLVRADRLIGPVPPAGWRVVAAAVHDAVDEQGRGAAHLARSQAGLDIAPDARLARRRGPVLVETRDVQTELGGVPSEIVVFERLLAMEQQLVHVPEAVLQCGCLGGGRRGERMRVDLVSGKCRKANRMHPFSCCSTCSIARNACREYGHS